MVVQRPVPRDSGRVARATRTCRSRATSARRPVHRGRRQPGSDSQRRRDLGPRGKRTGAAEVASARRSRTAKGQSRSVGYRNTPQPARSRRSRRLQKTSTLRCSAHGVTSSVAIALAQSSRGVVPSTVARRYPAFATYRGRRPAPPAATTAKSMPRVAATRQYPRPHRVLPGLATHVRLHAPILRSLR